MLVSSKNKSLIYDKETEESVDISQYIKIFAAQGIYKYKLHCKPVTVRSLLIGGKDYSLNEQKDYADSKCLAANIKESILKKDRDKDIAIEIYKAFLTYLKENGIVVNVVFPPIAISNTFERLMYIAKYLQDPEHKVADLYDVKYEPDKGNNRYSLWVSRKTIESDLKKLSGKTDADTIQICGKIFKIDGMEHKKNSISFPSTAHPLFLTPNLSQALVTLKGLKAMSENKLYAEYAISMAANIWEQLSDYAKGRIKYVLEELLPDDLKWYENLSSSNNNYFMNEFQCSVGKNIILDCLKNNKLCYLQYRGDSGVQFYSDCKIIRIEGEYVLIESKQGNIKLEFDKIECGAYTPEKLAEIL